MTRRAMALAAMVAATAACGESAGLPGATVDNFVDTVTLYALHGTPINTRSTYDVVNRSATNLALGDPFDFAFDFDSTGTPVLIPSGLLGIPSAAGLMASEKSFADLEKAPLDGYVTDSVLPLADGMTLVARSRSSSLFCSYLGALPRYGKFRVLQLDPVNRTVRLEALVNLNCGYRNLEEGVPSS